MHALFRSEGRGLHVSALQRKGDAENRDRGEEEGNGVERHGGIQFDEPAVNAPASCVDQQSYFQEEVALQLVLIGKKGDDDEGDIDRGGGNGQIAVPNVAAEKDVGDDAEDDSRHETQGGDDYLRGLLGAFHEQDDHAVQ